jgi:hypothetical protein
VGGSCSTHEREKVRRNSYNIFVGKPEGKEPRGRTSSRWEDKIRMDTR